MWCFDRNRVLKEKFKKLRLWTNIPIFLQDFYRNSVLEKVLLCSTRAANFLIFASISTGVLFAALFWCGHIRVPPPLSFEFFENCST
jgi:hypothetical protein